jgi:cytoskeletal protein RodZ
MTSNEVMALGRPRRGSVRRGLRLSIAALSLCLAMLAFSAMPVFAAETSTTTTSSSTTSTETGYSQTPAAPKEEKKVAPAKEEKPAPEKETEPAKEEAKPTTTTPAAKVLPFTGLDLRWIVGFGLLLILAGGGSLWMLGRRERHGVGR